MRWNPVPLAGGSYADSTRPWTSQDTVNWLPVKAERAGTRSDALLRDVPGLRPFAVAGTGPIRGAHNAEGKYFVVSGQELYQISTTGVAIPIGTVPGVGRVQIAHNQIDGGNEIEVANGTSGYVYNTVTEVFAQITDDGFPGAKTTRFLGQKLLQVEPFGRYWFESEVNAATSYNTIFRYPAEGAPDLILHVEPSQGEALVFGNRTIEVWSEQVTETASFQRGTVIERGAASAHSIVTLDNSCIFLGNDGIVYRLNGYTPVPISHRPLEGSLARLDLSKSFAFTWEDRGHKVAYFTFYGGQTWGYDIPQGEWHRRESYGLDRWRLNTLTQWNGMWVGGDFADGTLWELDWDYHKEGCDELVRKRRPPVMHDGGNRTQVHAVRIFADIGPKPAPPGELAITNDLPNGTEGDTISFQYASTGGVEPHTFEIIVGALPSGLTMDSAGLITGTAPETLPVSWTVRVTDCFDSTADLADSAAFVGLSGTLDDGTVGVAYSSSLTAGGGIVPYVLYDITAGSLPPGLSISAATGVISGTPT
jgi:hypothetical protein